jgi:hypothetical protein
MPSSAAPASGAPERLFKALDGGALRVGADEWRMTVFAVVDAAGRRWVQLRLDGAEHQVVTLRLNKAQGPSSAVHALSSWLANPEAEATAVLPRVAS